MKQIHHFLLMGALFLSFASSEVLAEQGSKKSVTKFSNDYNSKDIDADLSGDGVVNELDAINFKRSILKGGNVVGSDGELIRTDGPSYEVPNVYLSPWVRIMTFNANNNDPRRLHPVWSKGFSEQPEDMAEALKLISFAVEQYYPEGVRVFYLHLPGGSTGGLMASNHFLTIPVKFRDAIGEEFRALRDAYPDVKFGIYSGFCHISDPNSYRCEDWYPKLNNPEHVAAYQDSITKMQNSWDLDFIYLDNFSGDDDFIQDGYEEGAWIEKIREWGDFDFVGIEPLPRLKVSNNPTRFVVDESRSRMFPTLSLYRFYNLSFPDFIDYYQVDPSKELNIMLPHQTWQQLIDDGERTEESLIEESTCDFGVFLVTPSAQTHANNDHLLGLIKKNKFRISSNLNFMQQCYDYVPDHLKGVRDLNNVDHQRKNSSSLD